MYYRIARAFSLPVNSRGREEICMNWPGVSTDPRFHNEKKMMIRETLFWKISQSLWEKLFYQAVNRDEMA